MIDKDQIFERRFKKLQSKVGDLRRIDRDGASGLEFVLIVDVQKVVSDPWSKSIKITYIDGKKIRSTKFYNPLDFFKYFRAT